MRSSAFTLRVFRYENAAHWYAKVDLADPAVLWLVPWCCYDMAYPDRHPRSDVLCAGFDDTTWCPACTRLAYKPLSTVTTSEDRMPS